jgi:hypothetical protein
MERTQWVLTLHFNRGHNEVIKFDTKAAALDCIRRAVFVNEDCINFSCYRESVKISTAEEKLQRIQMVLRIKDKILAKM